LGALVLGTLSTAYAQSEAGGNDKLEEIVVTAQKRAENVQSVPIAITAVTADQIEAAGVVSTTDLASLVAGLHFNSTYAYFSPHLRGIGTTFYGAGVENPVSLYVDNVYYGSQLMAPSDLSDLSQVAVLKGPQGTLFGRNSTGGVIQMTTREPDSQLGGELRTELGNYWASRSFGYLTGSVSDTLKANLALTYDLQGDDWGRNLFNDDGGRKAFYDVGARTHLEWTPTDATTVKVIGDYERRKTSLGIDLRIIPGQIGRFPGLGRDFESSNVYDYALNHTSIAYYQGGGGSVDVQQDVGFAKVVSISGWRQFHYTQGGDVDASTLDVNYIVRKQATRQFTQELQLLSEKNDRFNWVLGGFYYWNQDVSDPFQVILNNGGGPDPGAQQAYYGGTVNDYVTIPTLRTRSLAFFAQSTLNVLDHTRLTTGIRYTRESRLLAGPPVLVYTDGAPPQLEYPQDDVPFALRDRESAPTWRVSVDQDLADGILGYLSYNRGFKSGGFNPNVPYDDFGNLSAPYLPEKVDTYEVGIKSELLDRRVRLNAAGFYNKYDNIQVLVVGPLTNQTANAPGAKTYGVDFEGEWRVTEGLRFNVASEWLHTKFTSYPNAPFYGPSPSAFGGIRRVNGDATGNSLPYAPDFTLDLSGDYTWSMSGGSQVDFNLTEAYNSGYYSEASNNSNLHQASFSLLNTSVSWRAPGGHLSVSLWGRNLVDQRIASTLLADAPTGYTGDYSNPPRTYGASVRYVFGTH
jgi:iron complex outermembrane recepter protein